MENKENLPGEVAYAGVPTIESYAANLQQKLLMCKLLRESGFAAANFKTDGAVLAAILYGQELGFSPIQALQCIDIIQGKPTISAAGVKAKILAEGGVIRDLEWTDKLCRIEGNRAGNKVITEYTMQEAVQAGLAGKDNWKRMPKDMLYARCVTRYARNHWADKIKGLYGGEEMSDAVIVRQQPAIECPVKSDEEVSKPKSDEWTGQELVTGGTYKDLLWYQLPPDYLEYIRHNGSKQTQSKAEQEISRRDASADEGQPDINDNTGELI